MFPFFGNFTFVLGANRNKSIFRGTALNLTQKPGTGFDSMPNPKDSFKSTRNARQKSYTFVDVPTKN